VATPVGRASPPTSSDALDEPLAGLADTVKIPDRLPPFALKDVDGRLTPIKRWDGRSLVINFWATWCAPCRREIPMLIELSAAWAERDVTVLGIAVDHPDAVAGFARQFKIPYPLLVGEQDALDVAGQLGVITPVFPFTVFTDRRGEVVALYIGELHRPQAELNLGVVRNVDEEQMPLAEARRTITQGLRSLPPQDKSG
jgi:thiol-disulfide isomerase/thioredoxin